MIFHLPSSRPASADGSSGRDAPRLYDGKEHVFRSDGVATLAPPGLMVQLLGFEPDRDGLQYEMSFYAGGSGVSDQFAIQCHCSESEFRALIERLNLRDIESVRSNARWAVDFAWLVGLENGTGFTRRDCETFVDMEKCAFQDAAAGCSDLLFAYDSDVNSWSAVWLVDRRANVLGFDQG